MKRVLFILIVVYLIVIVYSCSENRTIKSFNLNIEFDEPIANLKENDALPEYLQKLINYIDTSIVNDLLVPDVIFKRNDLQPPNTLIYESPLTWINKFRKNRGMLPSNFLKEDYNKLMEKLTTPKLLIYPKGKVPIKNASTDTRKNVLFLNLNTFNDDSIYALRERLVKKLIESKGITTFYIRFVHEKIDSIHLPFLIVTPLSKNVKKEADTLIFTVKSNINWQVKSDKTWCISNVTNGNGNDSVVAKYDNNKDSDQRLAELTFTGTGITKQTVTITQEGTNPLPPPPPKSLEEYFQKIADKSIPYGNKLILKKDIIKKYFVDEKSLVIEQGANKTEVGRSNIKDFVEELSQQNYKIEILDKKTNKNQKISILHYKEL